MNEAQATIEASGESPKSTQTSPASACRPSCAQVTPSSRSRAVERAFVRRFLKRSGLPDLTVHLPDGAKVSVGGTEPTGHAVSFQTRAALWRMLRDPENGFLDGFVD